MELRVLNYFLTVAREKTISKAAKTLHVTQPTLSKQLKELEQELGIKLFERGSREITLTEDGIYLQNRGQEIMTLVDLTISNLTNQSVVSGKITIGGGETEAFGVIAGLVHKLITDHPDIKVEIYSGNADDVLDKLDKGLLDFGLVIDPVSKQKYEYKQLPQKDRWGILLNNKNPLSKQEFVLAEELKEIPLLISNQSSVDNQLAEWFGTNLQNLNIVGTYNLLYNASVMVKEDIASALCIEGIINTEGTDLQFVPLSPSLYATINIVWKKNRVFSNAANQLLTLL
ncbi:LysR family transcriptional regulator [Enterococcus thailandicus]|uniref:LysR family transcriptional regulator n=1 Tax=Enterococcus thailandicus TaxID=417368 RepID=UPI0022EBEE44|nr:LysR family transcriptional regulator [Enterococcus thailandicus]MDA3973957.1 LysR family transcriptional regulator [Enterococcus thailandicus]MDA3976233.1 LysR family transcriptional regulator [Enterococcus thailandicus]MDA3981198.1 LysR family transcriptional regulator [Enterococcus thailandicus]